VRASLNFSHKDTCRYICILSHRLGKIIGGDFKKCNGTQIVGPENFGQRNELS